MLAGTALVLEAVPYAANGDRRYDRVTWKSSRPGVADVTPLGHLTARAAGRGALTAAGGKGGGSWAGGGAPNPGGRPRPAPAHTAGGARAVGGFPLAPAARPREHGGA